MGKGFNNIVDNAQRLQAGIIISQKEALATEHDVLKQIDELLDSDTKKLSDLETLYNLHPDIEHIVADYKKQENRVKELMAVRELSEEAIKQYELNLSNLGENVETNE